MARLQYQPATRPRGFQPIQLSRAGIARMEEESNRIIRGMERQRDAEIRQRDSDLQDMRDNSEYERRARDRNQDIENRNFENEQLAIQNQAKSRQAQAQADEQAFKSTVGALVDFSVTAGKVAAERTKQMIIDQTEEGRQARLTEYRNNPEAQINFNTTESQIGIETVKADNITQLAGAKGLETPNETSKSLLANPGRGYYWQKGYYNQLVKEQTPLLLNRAFQGTEALFTDQAGNQFSGIEAVNDPARTNIVLDTVLKNLYGSTGLNISELEPGFLADSNDAVDKIRSSYIQRSIQGETKQNFEALKSQGQNLRDSGEIQQGYLIDLKNPLVGREQALQNVFDLYYAKNADGSFRYSKEELDNLNLLGEGTILETRGNSQRYQDAIAARVKARTDTMREDQARTKVEAKDFDNQAYNGLSDLLQKETNPARDLEILETFKTERAKLFNNEGLSDKIIKLEQSVLAGNIETERVALANQIRLKTLSPEFIDSINSPKIQGQAIIEYKKLKKERLGPDYARTEKIIKEKALFVTKLNKNLVGKENYQTFIFEKAAKNEYEYSYKAAIESGVNPETAQVQALAYVDKVVNEGLTDPNSNFYRATGPLNSFIFPNLETKYTNLSELQKESQQELLKGILKKGIKILDAPNALGSVEDLEESNNNYYSNNGKFSYNPMEQLASKIFDVPLYAVRNARTQAFNKADGGDRRLIEPTVLEKEVFNQEPRTIKLITDTQRASDMRFNRAVSISTRNTGPMRASMQSTSFNLDQLTDKDYNDLAYAISSEAALGTDDEFGVAANILTRLKTGGYGNTIEEIINAPGQYEGVYKGLSRPSPEIAAKLKSPEGKAKIKEFIKRLDGRTEFKGQTMLKNRVSSEDPMFDPAGNFYHYAGQ